MGMDILSRIVEYKKEEIRKLQRIRPEAVLRTEAEGADICRRSFINRLSDRRTSDIRIIAEIKRASPSRGDIRMDLDVAQFAAAYARGGAAAISVLTESRWFKGGVEDLIIARRATALPVLRKDFIVSKYQIYESAVIGADAVLLIARILSKNQLEEYLALCAAFKMDALVEVHTTEDLETIKNIDARLIGINNRNLTSFKTDIRHAVNLAARLADDQIPVALSGIHTREDIEQTAQAGICNFLIGESIMRSSDPEKFIRSLLTSGV
jgi:indole-3-glycerol phosphate synthase